MNGLDLRAALPRMYGHGINVDNVNEALPIGLDLVRAHGVPVISRGVGTLEVPGPVMTVYRSPTRRVLFDEARDANPFFHLIESLWILGGGKTVHLPKLFLDSITRFSDDGETFHGAYGHRLRYWEVPGCPPMDQLHTVIDLLRNKPDTRQAVVSIWDPSQDLGAVTKDVPCNDMIMFSARDGFLHMTVCNRSNDVIWGAYGANAVQFSMIQEVVAVAAGLEVGYYAQQSNSYHVYPDNPFWSKFLSNQHAAGHVHNPYMDPAFQPYPVATNASEALLVLDDCLDLVNYVDGTVTRKDILSRQWTTPFFKDVVVPMVRGYEAYKDGEYKAALNYLYDVAADDWRLACCGWVARRMVKSMNKEAAE